MQVSNRALSKFRRNLESRLPEGMYRTLMKTNWFRDDKFTLDDNHAVSHFLLTGRLTGQKQRTAFTFAC